MTDWPTSLPQAFLRATGAATIADNRLRSSVDVGPAKVRRRSVVSTRPLVGQMLLSASQLTTLKTFYTTTVEEVGTFNFPNPDGGDDLTVRFGGEPIKAEYLTTGIIRVTLDFEVMP